MEPRPLFEYATLRCAVLRLLPGQDLKAVLQDWAVEERVSAASVISAVGSLTDYQLRFANQQTGSSGSGWFEILSLCGTLSAEGCHLHLSLADSEGHCLGGHLLPGNRIYTTAEIVVGLLPELAFQRDYDAATGFRELFWAKK